MRLPVIHVRGDEKLELLSKIMDRLETRETKKTMAVKITPVRR